MGDAIKNFVNGHRHRGENPPAQARHVDYVGLARKINREHDAALGLLEAYDRGEARIVAGKLQRI